MNGRNKSDGRRAGIINSGDASYSHPSEAIWKSDPGCHELLLSEELLCSPSNLKKKKKAIKKYWKKIAASESLKLVVSKTNCYVSSVQWQKKYILRSKIIKVHLVIICKDLTVSF